MRRSRPRDRRVARGARRPGHHPHRELSRRMVQAARDRAGVAAVAIRAVRAAVPARARGGRPRARDRRHLRRDGVLVGRRDARRAPPGDPDRVARRWHGVLERRATPAGRVVALASSRSAGLQRRGRPGPVRAPDRRAVDRDPQRAGPPPVPPRRRRSRPAAAGGRAHGDRLRGAARPTEAPRGLHRDRRAARRVRRPRVPVRGRRQPEIGVRGARAGPGCADAALHRLPARHARLLRRLRRARAPVALGGLPQRGARGDGDGDGGGGRGRAGHARARDQRQRRHPLPGRRSGRARRRARLAGRAPRPAAAARRARASPPEPAHRRGVRRQDRGGPARRRSQLPARAPPSDSAT